jgi:cytosine deaminase
MPAFDDIRGLQIAIDQAKKSASEGGIPIGAALLSNINGELKVEGKSHNQRVQKDSAILHGETAALEDAGRLRASVYQNSTMVSAVYINLSRCSCR